MCAYRVCVLVCVQESPLLWRERWNPILTLPEAVTTAHLQTFFISLLLGTLCDVYAVRCVMCVLCAVC